MLAVTFNSVTAYLLDEQPNWASPVTVDVALPASYERGLTGRETRRLTGDTLRIELKWKTLLTSSLAITNLRNALQAHSTEYILCPFWPGQFAAGTMPVMTAAFYVLLDDSGTAPSIQAAAALGSGFSRTAYPLLVGRLVQTPDPTVLVDTVLQVSFHFAEDSSYALTPPTFAAPTGISAASGVRPLFPFAPNWESAPSAGGSEVDIERRQIGNVRSLASAYFAQRGRRKVGQSFTLTGAEAFNLLSFFTSMGGEQNNFWLPAAISEAALTANVASAATALTVDNGAALGTNTFILLNDNLNRVPLIVSSVAGNTWNLSAAPGTAFGANTTRIESLVLARFDTLKLSLTFDHLDLAHTELQFNETPWETNAVSGETINATQGALPTTALLFTFSQTTPSGTTYWRLTNFERDLTNSGNTWTSAPIECDEITETATLERSSVTVRTRNFSGNPLALLIPFMLEWPLMLEVNEVDIASSAASNLHPLFYGEVGSCSVEPPFLDADCQTLSSIFDRQIPRRLYQRNDNWILFEPANGLNATDWQWNAVVVSYTAATATLVVGTITSSNGATLAAHFFAAGYLTVTHSGAKQVRMIGDNTAPSAGQMTIVLTSPLATAPSAGDVVNLFAGYDGTKETCISKFSNYANFGGFPFMPVGNPSVLKITNAGGGGKK
jgi:hypothetical protein